MGDHVAGAGRSGEQVSLHARDRAELAADLRASVRDYRDRDTEEWNRYYIREYWAALGIPNQFAAMLRAAELDPVNDDKEPPGPTQ